MTDKNGKEATVELDQIIESAAQLGVEIDEAEALSWLSAMAAQDAVEEIVEDNQTGVFGHKVVMLDFSPAELARFRQLGKLVEFEDIPGRVETALALSGSAAQSKVQKYPGDCDFFERVNIIADTREEACQVLAGLMRQKALRTRSGPGYHLIEVKFGSYPQPVMRDGRPHSEGGPISWTAADIEAGYIVVNDMDDSPMIITWDEAGKEPGWCKLDWVVTDPTRQQLANASNMLDVTWEGPDGTIVPLDGYLDGYFQEVYLDAESVPIFSKLIKQMSPDVLDEYVSQLEKEVAKHFHGPNPNYGKVAKRLYNVFRMTGRYEEAAFLRELFDEPAALLYQVHALIRTVDDVINTDSAFSVEELLAQIDELIMTVIRVLEGASEVEIVRYLLRMEHAICRHATGIDFRQQLDAARDEVLNIVNNFFYEKMRAVPEIRAYLDEVPPLAK